MKKDILRIYGANLLKMLVTFLTAFIIPMVLSVEQYGYLKTYQFYVSYLGILHLGFCDGIYLEYGGQDINKIDKKRMACEHKTLLIYEMFIMSIFLFVGVLKGDFILVVFALTVVPGIMSTYYTYTYQAVGEFKTYTSILNLSTVTNLVANLILVLCHVQDYRIYVIVYCLVQYISGAIGIIFFGRCGWINLQEKASLSILIKYIKFGILLMIGNFVYIIFLGIDKWFIKFTLDISQFSMYSFATQMMTIVNMVITPIAMTLYSNMRSRMNQIFEIRIKNILLGILMVMPAAIFVIKFIIDNFIDKYKQVIPVMSILIIMQLFLCLNTALFVNLYKVYRQQKAYFVRLIIAVMIAFLLDLGVSIVCPCIEGYAIASLIACLFWLIENILYFKYMHLTVREILFIGGLIGVFICMFAMVDNVLIQIAVYMIVYLILMKVLMKDFSVFVKTQIHNIYARFVK
mgnify:CR=1 FL=1